MKDPIQAAFDHAADEVMREGFNATAPERADQWPAELIEKALAEGLPPFAPNRISTAAATADAPAIAFALDGAIVPTIAKALCRHTTRHPGCACGDDPVVCFAMAIFGDQAVAVARDLKRRGLLR